MARQLARSPLTIEGRTYTKGEPVPVEKLPPKLRRQLIDQRRVVSDSIRVPGSKGRR